MAIDIIELVETKEPISTKRSNILATICLIVGILIFAAAFISMDQHIGLWQFNKSILSWMVNNRTDNLTLISKIITNMGGTLFLVAITAVIAAIWAITKRELWRPILLIISMAFAATTSILLKSIIKDPRPLQENMIPTFEVDYSFPSGHTLATVTFLLVIGYLIYSRHFSKSRLIFWLAVALVGSGFIAVTRLYLGYHWLTDVIASIGLGLVILAAIITIDKFGASRRALDKFF